MTASPSLSRILGSNRAQPCPPPVSLGGQLSSQGIQHLRLPKIPGFWGSKSLKRELKAFKLPLRSWGGAAGHSPAWAPPDPGGPCAPKWFCLAGLGVALSRAEPWQVRGEGRTGQGRGVPQPRGAKCHPVCPQTLSQGRVAHLDVSPQALPGALALLLSLPAPLQDQLRLRARLINTPLIALSKS